jgi:serine/threonine protein kinase/tetratricopeptide (TPR) repeat protein
MTGQTLGHYRILEKIAAGGMGVVYRAHDEQLERDVALKVLPSGTLSDNSSRRLFRKEALALAKLSHPNIETIYEFDTQDGIDFLVMEYVPGNTLAERLGRGALPEREVVALGMQIAAAMEEAHSRGIVHRDLKPRNIAITVRGQAKVLDFGLAKLLPQVNEMTSDTLADTQAGAGTLPYMPPEQLQGESVDARADIYTIGAVLYEMATDRRAFPEELPSRVIDAILHHPPVTPRALNPRISPELERIILKCLDKDPGRRFQSAKELSVDLRRLDETTSIPSRAPVPRPSIWKRISTPAKCAAAVLLAILIALFWQNLHTLHDRLLVLIRPQSVFANQGWILIADPENLTDQPLFDETLGEGLTLALQQSRYLNVFPRARIIDALGRMQKKNVARVDEVLGREICQRENVHVLLVSSIRSSGGRFQITVRGEDPANGDLRFAESEQFTRKEELFDRVDRLAARTRMDLGESLAGIKENSKPLAKVTTGSLEALQLYSRAADAVAEGDPDRAQPLLQSALELDPDFAMAHRLLATVYLSAGNREKEAEHLTRAYGLRSNVTYREQRLIEASYYSVQGQYEKATDSLLPLANLYPNDPDVQYELALSYLSTGNGVDAEKYLRQVLKLNPFSTPAYDHLGRVLARRNENAAAIEIYRQAAGRGLQTPSLHWGLGLALMGEGKVEEASAEFSQLQGAGKMYQNIGRLYVARTAIYEGKLTSAAEQLDADIRWDQSQASKSAELLRRYLLARIFIQRGMIPQARHQLELILTEGEPEALQAEDLRRAGTLYARMGDVKSAQSVLHKLELLGSKLPSSFNKSCSQNLAGEIALAQGRFVSAVELFSAVETEYPRFASHEGLARTYQAQSDWNRAASAWQQVLQDRGEILQDSFPADWVVAHLELGRVYQHLSDSAQARREYDEFLRTWKDADELPVRQQALQEWQQMTGEIYHP